MRRPADHPTKNCTLEDCGRPLRARGYCNYHYSKLVNPRVEKPTPMMCDGCGVTVMRIRGERFKYTYCSELCRHWIQWGAWSSNYTPRYAAMTLALYKPRPLWHRAVPDREIIGRRRTFVDTECAICGARFICLYGSQTCSNQCATDNMRNTQREIKYRRRAAMQGGYVARVYRSKIFERDEYDCQLCGEPLAMTVKAPHRLAPTIDHVIPLAKGGTHEPANVQAAHFYCNSLKGDRVHIFEGPPIMVTRT